MTPLRNYGGEDEVQVRTNYDSDVEFAESVHVIIALKGILDIIQYIEHSSKLYFFMISQSASVSLPLAPKRLLLLLLVA